MSNEKQVVGRFAPTPSGRMHLGNVFAALIAWCSVRSKNGEMVLRMEDLDTQRTSEEFAAVLRDDLGWLGLDYDRETSAQSKRSAVYDQYFEKMQDVSNLHYLYMLQNRHSIILINNPYYELSLLYHHGQTIFLISFAAPFVAKEVFHLHIFLQEEQHPLTAFVTPYNTYCSYHLQ
jgi:hypothetical protein